MEFLILYNRIQTFEAGKPLPPSVTTICAAHTLLNSFGEDDNSVEDSNLVNTMLTTHEGKEFYVCFCTCYDILYLMFAEIDALNASCTVVNDCRFNKYYTYFTFEAHALTFVFVLL
jgi:hypothetical protein